MTVPKVPHAPKHPERVCWGCDRYCPADDMVCGNGTIRAPHPIELFGEDWLTAFDSEPQQATDRSYRGPATTTHSQATP
jgi:hypothetical protein